MPYKLTVCTHLNRFSPQNHKIFRSHHHKAHKLVAQNFFYLVSLNTKLAGQEFRVALYKWLNQFLKCKYVSALPVLQRCLFLSSSQSLLLKPFLFHSCWLPQVLTVALYSSCKNEVECLPYLIMVCTTSVPITTPQKHSEIFMLKIKWRPKMWWPKLSVWTWWCSDFVGST